MYRPRDVFLRAGFYIAVTFSSIAAAYVLKEWLPHLWDRNPPRVPPPSASDDSNDDKASSQQDHCPLNTDSCQCDEVPVPVTDPSCTLPTPGKVMDARTPSTNQSRTLAPLLTHSLPPPLLSGSALSFVHDAPSPTSTGSLHTSSEDEDGVEDDPASQTDRSDTLADSFLEVLSPSPTHVISRRRSNVRAHDLFAESHISFAELGNLVAPQISE